MTTLLLDADIIAYQSCAAVEHEVQWDEDTFTIHSSLEDAKAVFYDMLGDLQEQARADDLVFCWSDSANFRKDLEPTYKAHRKSQRKPLAYKALRDYISGRYGSFTMKNLEGDDVLGWLATGGADIGEDVVVWSLDKDLKQIPGKHLIDDEIVEISLEDADRFHLYQTLVGDSADGYKGCPGIGPVKAEKIVSGGWVAVVEAYNKAGLTEEDALLQARLARIIRHEDYDITKEKVKLWTP